MRVRPLVRAGLFACFLTGSAGMAGCNLLGGPSKVKAGELVETGEARYDAYFKEVHDLQVAATGWNDDRKAACRGLVDALKLNPDAADVSIVQATHERVNLVARDVGPIRLEVTSDDAHLTAGNAESVDDTTRELFRAIEICAHAESQRAKNLRVIPPKVDGLNKAGRELEPHIREDFGRRGGRVGMDVQQEMLASYSALDGISREARNGARGAEDFVADLQRAITTDGGPPEPANERTAKGTKPRPDKSDRAEPKSDPKGESKPTAKSEPKRTAASGSPPKPARPAEKPKPKPPPPSEVFNP
ncbi:hypothetical protein [Pendulispora albinea]|uniref:Lipoprotein n=1 Tax=Pendulispora albinea TaxID=2741071 RepID=A0ABZ2LYB7_9BACT